jgi:hypothetical protein
MGNKSNKIKTKINSFDFAPDKIMIQLIANRSSDMSDFQKLVKMFQKEFTDLHITLNEGANNNWFVFNIESDSYIKFKRIRKIFNFLERVVVINDAVDVETDDIYF